MRVLCDSQSLYDVGYEGVGIFAGEEQDGVLLALVMVKKLILAIVLCWVAIHLVFALPLIIAAGVAVALVGGFVLFVSVPFWGC